MLTRVITAVVALGIFAAALIAPPIVFTVALSAVILIMLYECYSATKADTAMKVVGFLSAALIICAIWVMGSAKTAGLPFFIAIVILMYMGLVVKKHGQKDYKVILSNGFLTLYIILSMVSVWYIKETYGTATMLVIFVCAWSTDTFAYFSGKLLGKHKLIPHVSPKKTVEGSIGGVIGATAICLLYNFILSRMGITIPLGYVGCAAYGVIGGVFSQAGDLTASAIKRDSGIKDFGWIFPGHGGFMDRFDSVMYIAPILFFVILTGSMI